MHMSTLHIKTYGCQMNKHDSDRIASMLSTSLGLKLVHTAEEADIILFNTCSIREKAANKIFSDLGRIKPLTLKKKNLIIGVGGCVAVQAAETIFKRVPYVNLVFGPQSLYRLPTLLMQAQHKRIIDIDYTPIEKLENLPLPSDYQPSADVSIIEGCHHFCTYCIVPYVRGRAVSRSFSSILNEVNVLAKNGTKEIHLLGQNVNCYLDARQHNIRRLSDLLYRIADIPGVERIRMTTSHPAYFSTDLIQAYRDLPKIVNHVHLPVQSGSNTVLKKMNRKYTKEDYLRLTDALKTIRPNISISSDFIVGFPFETDADFEDTLNLVRQIRFDRSSFSFMYNPRPQTKAAKFGDPVPLWVKKERIKILQKLLLKYERAISQSMLHTIQRILITGTAKKSPHQVSGRTENNRIVNIDGSSSLIGKMLNVRVIQVMSNSLQGKVIE
jgi:tRNA-2-methylthio-N6-dimethylallyladenosine synthase